MNISEKVVQRFWSKVDISMEDECWEWKAGFYRDGYGGFHILNKSFKAHRVAWMIIHGEIPDGLCVCHKCDNKRCVNPEHLFLGTITDNNRDMVQKKRQNHAHRFKKSEIRKILAKYQRGYSIGSIANEYSVNFRTIHRVIHGISYRKYTGV